MGFLTAMILSFLDKNVKKAVICLAIPVRLPDFLYLKNSNK